MPDRLRAWTPIEAGERVLNGVIHNDLFIITHPEYMPGTKTRFDAMLESEPKEDTPPSPDRVRGETRVLTCGHLSTRKRAPAGKAQVLPQCDARHLKAIHGHTLMKMHKSTSEIQEAAEAAQLHSGRRDFLGASLGMAPARCWQASVSRSTPRHKALRQAPRQHLPAVHPRLRHPHSRSPRR